MCKLRGGTLANLGDWWVDQNVRDFIAKNHLDGPPCITGYGFFIGLNDRDDEGNYVWSNGEPLCPGSYTNWAPGEPNNNDNLDPDGQDCAQLWYVIFN